MLPNILAEEGGVRETEPIADLFYAEIGLFQIISDILENMLSDPFISSLS
jgi:hypothetical protein